MLPSSSSSSSPGSHHFQQHHRQRSSSLRRAANAAAADWSSSSGIGGLLTLEVTFLDNTTKAFSLPRKATAGDLVKVIVDRFGLVSGNEEDLLPFFGLVESYTGTTLDRPVNKAEPLAALLAQIGPDPLDHSPSHQGSQQSKLVFMLRAPAFPCLQQLSQRDPALLHHRYIQAVHAVITAPLPSLLTSDVLLLRRLACLQLRARFGRSKGDDVCDAAFARALGPRVVEYIPAAVFHDKKAAAWREGMAALLDADPVLRRLSETEAQHAYLSLVEKEMPALLSAALFPGAVADPGTADAKEVVLAVDGEGLAVYDPLDVGKEAASRVGLQAMAQWGFWKGLFYYTVKDGTTPVVVNYGTEEGAAICETLTGAAYAFLKNGELLGRWTAEKEAGRIGAEEEGEDGRGVGKDA